MVRVVLVDTGLIDGYDDSRITGGCSIEKSEDGYSVCNGYSDHIGHGTAAADIILKNSKNAEIYIVRIYEEDLYIDEDKLCYALEYIRSNLEYDIIQISSGVLTYSSELARQVSLIAGEDNKLVISAFDNEGGMSYPAALEDVIGIDVDTSYRKKDEFEITENNVIDVRGAEVFFRVPWIDSKKNIVKGTSFLTSYFTARIADDCNDGLNKNKVMEYLRSKAKYTHPNIEKRSAISSSDFVKNIKHAITFPFNKEIYCLAAYEDMLPFKIDGYYDVKHKFLIGKKISEVLPYTDNDSVIENVDNIDWNAEFDTVICGHLSEISSVTKTDYLMRILELCYKHKKRVYVFDDLSLRDENYRNTVNLFSPIVEYDRNLSDHFGKLRTCNRPVLAVLGTSSRQGKYTVQLELMREFRKRNIKVDGISTEPTGALFSFSEMFACGYGSKNYLSGYEMIRVLNNMIFRLECQDNELIITGGQSGTIAYDMRNESLIPLEQYSYITGVNPDGVILCVNEIDDFSYVRKTINFIESVSNAEVFAIIISPVHNDQDEGINEKPIAELIQEEYGNRKSCYRLNELDIKVLVDEVIKYYD